MGIENRDYVREDNSSGGGGGAFTASFGGEHPVVRNLIIATLTVFALQFLWTRTVTEADFQKATGNNSIEASATANGRISVPQQWLCLDSIKVQQGQVWRLLTAGFCHTRITLYGVVINMVILFWLGRPLKDRFGSRAFLGLYLTAIIVCSLSFVGLQMLRGGEAWTTMGATGPIMAMLVLYTLLHPREHVNFFGVLPIPFTLIVLFFVLYQVAPLLMIGFDSPATAIHLSYLFGLAYGFIFWKTEFSLANIVPKFSKGQRRNDRSSANAEQSGTLPFGQAQPEKEPTPKQDRLDAEVDQILAKISESGKDSLSRAELKTLDKASARYSKKM